MLFPHRIALGKWVEMHTAWMILHSSVAADVEFDSPATTMRLVLTQLAERAAEGTVDALVEVGWW